MSIARQMPNESNSYEVVIVGAGLAGLSCAMTISQTKSVLLIECRDEKLFALRPQLIHLNQTMIDNLQRLCTSEEDGEFFHKLRFNCHFAIKDIQHFLYSKIGTRCTILFNSKISSINMENGDLLISQDLGAIQKNIKANFKKFFFLTEGGNRETAKLLGQFIQFQPVAGRPQLDNVTACFTITKNNEAPIKSCPVNQIGLVIDGAYCGYIYYERWHEDITTMKISITMNVSPERAYAFKHDKSLMTEYLTHCVASVFDDSELKIEITKSDKEGEAGLKKDDLKAAFFTMKFMEVIQAAFMYKGRTVASGGDGKRDADFFLGHGGCDALDDGIKLMQLANQNLTVEDYNAYSKMISTKIARGTQLFQNILEKPPNPNMQKYYIPPFTMPREIKLPEEKFVSMGSPITEQGDKHSTLLMAVKFKLSKLNNYETKFEPFLREVKNKNYPKALRLISNSTSEFDLVCDVTRLLLSESQRLQITFDINEAPKGYLALHYAVEKRNNTLCQILMSYGADPDLLEGVGKVYLKSICKPQ